MGTREVIVVIGMHRCGTSTISGMMFLAGYHIGKNPQETDFFNEKGYFENTRFGIFNNELLNYFSASWCDTIHVPDDKWSDPLLDPFRERLRIIIAEEFENEPRFLIKDPRISILLPFYLDVFHNLSIIPKFIISFRDPLAVATSLQMRNNLSMSRSSAIWMDYLLRAEKHSRGYNRVFLSYDDILQNPTKILKSILTSFSSGLLIDSDLECSLKAFVDPRLRHNSIDIMQSDDAAKGVSYLYNHLLYYRHQVQDKRFSKIMNKQYRHFFKTVNLFTGLDPIPKVMLQTVSMDKSRVTQFQPCHKGHNHFEFTFEPAVKVSHLILLPFNHRVLLGFNGFNITENDQHEYFTSYSYSNATYKMSTEVLTFNTVNPEIGCYFSEPKQIIKICFDLEILQYGNSLMHPVTVDGNLVSNTNSLLKLFKNFVLKITSGKN